MLKSWPPTCYMNVTLFLSFSDHVKTVPAPLLATPPRHLPTVKLTGRQEWLLSFIKHWVTQRNLWLVSRVSFTTSLKRMVNKTRVKKLGSWATPSAWQITVSMKKTCVINSHIKSYGVDWVFTLVIKGLWELHQHNQWKWLVLMAFQNSTSKLMISRCIFLQLVQTVLSFSYGILIFPKAERGAWGLRKELLVRSHWLSWLQTWGHSMWHKVGAQYTMNGWLNEPKSGKLFLPLPPHSTTNSLDPCHVFYSSEMK